MLHTSIKWQEGELAPPNPRPQFSAGRVETPGQAEVSQAQEIDGQIGAASAVIQMHLL